MTKVLKHKNPPKRSHQPSGKILQGLQPSAYVRGTPKRDEGSSISSQEAADLALLQKVADHIEIHYSGHQWALNVSHEQGVLMISIPLFMGSTNYYVVPLEKLKSDPGYKLVTEACGHILERYKLPRSALNQDSFMDLLERFPAHRKGTTHGHIPK